MPAPRNMPMLSRQVDSRDISTTAETARDKVPAGPGRVLGSRKIRHPDAG